MELEMLNKVDLILTEIFAERERQHDKFGIQDHPNGTREEFREVSAEMRELCDSNFKIGKGTWLNIFFEEVYEVACETNVKNLRIELIQVAAVSCAWIESIDRIKDVSET
jgi:hypothetical protein